jgi:hypothetical protein
VHVPQCLIDPICRVAAQLGGGLVKCPLQVCRLDCGEIHQIRVNSGGQNSDVTGLGSLVQ